jgi:protein-S-isoprenylcysteine O-methyltransferase Ste14
VSSLADLTLVAWALVEVGVRVREGVQGKGRPDRDRATRVLIAVTLGAAFVAALGARSVAPTLRMPEPLRLAGVVVMWLGLALRVWAIAALGGSFRTTVEVEPGQTVVSTGPFRWIRHPSYAGLLLIVAGFGAALGNWLSLAACVALPLPAIVWPHPCRGSRAQPRPRRRIPHVPVRQGAPDPRALVRTRTDFRCERDRQSP